MAISKIILNGVTQMDVTQDTVTASTLMSGETAHDAAGIQITGTASGGITPTGTISITSNGTYDVTNYASATVNVSGGGGDYSLVRCYVSLAPQFTGAMAKAVYAVSLTGISSIMNMPTTQTEIYVPRIDASHGILVVTGTNDYYWPYLGSSSTGATEQRSSNTTNISVEEDAVVIITISIRD